jgi:hypothetical protein
MQEADVEDSESSKVYSTWAASHNHILPQVTGPLPSSGHSVASKAHRKSFEPPSSPSLLHPHSIAQMNHGEELLAAAGRPAPSLAASYREASLHAMGLEKALSIPHMDVTTTELSHSSITASDTKHHHGAVHPHGAIPAPNSTLYVSHSMNRI